MKIGVKITLLIVSAIIGLVTLFLVSLSSLYELDDKFTYIGDSPMKNVELANELIDGINMSARQTAMICFDFDNITTRAKACHDAVEAVVRDLAALKSRPNHPDFITKVGEFEKSFDNFMRIRVGFLDAVGKQDWEAAREIRTGEFAAAINHSSDAALALCVFATDEAYNYAYVVSSEMVSDTVRNLIIIAVAIAAVLIVIAVIIILGITRPLSKAVTAAEKIAAGDFEVDLTTTAKDETGALLNSLEHMVDSFNLMDKDLITVTDKVIDGALSYRSDISKHKGHFKGIMKAINSLVEAFVDPIKVTANFLEKVADGDSSIQKITKEYKGDFNDIKNNINKTADVLFLFLEELGNLSDGAKAGNLSKRADCSQTKGTWKGMLGSVNDIVDAAEHIIADAGHALEVMATGDLTPRVKAEYKGKFNDMKNNINNLGDALTDLISQLQEAIHTTASASAQISSTADSLAAATQEQSSQTDEVASAMEEMSRTVTDNAHSATRTAEVARKSGQVANEGGAVVKQTVTKMREIAAVVKTSADNISKLGESSKKIGEIISVIDDIADQTNLLSLNAAIEAARAGEQGRGFAVVADSVGKLAISTASATKEIADMIKGIQLDTEAAVKAMEKGTSEVQSGIELADNAGNSLQDILSGINELLDMVNQIAAASEEQSATSEQISKNVSSISKVTGESARNVEDVASTANELARMTDTLTSLVSQFKISSHGHHNNSLMANN